MSISAFDVQDDEIYKAMPDFKGAAGRVGAAARRLRPAGHVRGAGMRSPGAVADLAKPGAAPSAAQRLRGVGDKIRNADYRPVTGIAGARRLTPAGIGYAAGAGGVGVGLAARGSGRRDPVHKSAFGVDDQIYKAMPGGKFLRRLVPVAEGGKHRVVQAANGARMRSTSAIKDLTAPTARKGGSISGDWRAQTKPFTPTAAAPPTAGGRLAGVGDKIKNAEYRPLAFTKDGLRLTTAGKGYAVGAGGVGVGMAARGGRRDDRVAKSAFGVEDTRLSKVAGDKRKTKYAAAGTLGYTAGAQAGSRVGARVAGTRVKVVNRDATAAMTDAVSHLEPKDVDSLRGVKAAGKQMFHAAGKVPGYKATVRGGLIGGATGTAAAVGGYAAYRHNKSVRQH